MRLNGTFQILADKAITFTDGVYKCGANHSIAVGDSGLNSAIESGESIYAYIRAYNPDTGDTDLKRFKLLLVDKAGSGRKKYTQFTLQPEVDDGYALYNGELEEDTLNGILTTLSSDRGFAYIPTVTSGLSEELREELRNTDLAYYEAKRTKEIDDIVQDLKENYAKAETITSIQESVNSFDSSISDILTRLGATETQVNDIRDSLLSRLSELELKVQSHSETLEEVGNSLSDHDTRITELESKQNDLQAHFNEHVEKTNENIAQWNENFESHKQAILALDDRDKQIVAKINSHSDTLDDLLSKVTLSTDGIESLTSEFNEVKDRVQELEQDNEVLRTAVSDNLQNLKNSVDTNKANIESLQRDALKLSNDFEDMGNKYTQAMESINSFTNDIENINTKNQEISDHLDSIDSSFEGINTDIEGLKAKDVIHDNQITGINGTTDSLIAKDVVHDTDIADLKAKVQSMSEDMEINNQQIVDLIEETEAKLSKDISDTQELLSDEIGTLQEHDTTHDQQISQIVFKNTTQDNDISSLKDRADALETKVQEHDTNNETIIQELKSLKSSVKDNGDSIKLIDANIESLQNTDADHTSRIEALESASSTLNSDYEIHKTEFNTHKEYVIQELTTLKGRVQTNEGKIKELDNSITAVQEQIEGELGSFKETANYEIQGLKDLTNTHSSDIAQLKQDIQDININISDLEGCTKAVQIDSEDQIEALEPYTFGLLTDSVDLGEEVDYSQILVDITTLKTQNFELLSRVKSLESENQNLKLKIGD